MRHGRWRAVALAAALGVAGCDLHDVMFGLRPATVAVRGELPIELVYREGPMGLVILPGRVNGKADVDFILDTGAPVTVLIEDRQTAALALDVRNARPLGDPSDPASPVGAIQSGFDIAFAGVSLTDVTAVVIPNKAIPCRERVESVGFAGVVGADLFRRFVVEIDPAARRVRLHEPRGWQPPEGMRTVPLAIENGHVFVDAKVLLASGSSVATRLHLDTGMSRGLVLVAGSGSAIPMPEGESHKACYVSGMREERIGPAVDLDLASARLSVARPVYAARDMVPAVQRNGAMGNAALGGRRVFIDYTGRRLAFSAPAS